MGMKVANNRNGVDSVASSYQQNSKQKNPVSQEALNVAVAPLKPLLS